MMELHPGLWFVIGCFFVLFNWWLFGRWNETNDR
jgi:hypothetical protein